jgi:hypothetical protein
LASFYDIISNAIGSASDFIQIHVEGNIRCGKILNKLRSETIVLNNVVVLCFPDLFLARLASIGCVVIDVSESCFVGLAISIAICAANIEACFTFNDFKAIRIVACVEKHVRPTVSTRLSVS